MPSSFAKNLSFDAFRNIAHHYAAEKQADVLLGAPGYPDACMSYLCLGPCDELTLEAGASADGIASRIKAFAFADARPAIGFISYECGHVLHGVQSEKAIDYPYVRLKKYAAVLAHNALSGELAFVHGEAALRGEIDAAVAAYKPMPPTGLPRFDPGNIRLSLDEQGYKAGVAQTLDFIRDGLVYQLNLTTKFTLPAQNIDPVQWFFALYERFPAPYYALLHNGQQRILSTSPELFLRVEDGQVRSEPIKGTLRFDRYSDAMVQQLAASAKEDAELSMIVDLVRNDISADCRYGSVVVQDHKSVFAVDNLLQMYSRVRGELADGHDCVDLLLNAFPGGSITGCPKKSAMQLIDQLEPHTRGPYCGSVVMIHGPQDMVSSIAIRTAVHDTAADEITYWAGSGIVIDSQPEAEFQETLAKAGKILNPELL